MVCKEMSKGSCFQPGPYVAPDCGKPFYLFHGVDVIRTVFPGRAEQDR